jgi:hypothetical protein
MTTPRRQGKAVKTFASIVLVLALLANWRIVAAEDLLGQSASCLKTKNSCCPKALLSACPDDYYRKPFPRPCSRLCLGCDDYCSKPYPKTYCLPNGGFNDYCQKPCPDLCRPISAADYICDAAPRCSLPPQAKKPKSVSRKLKCRDISSDWNQWGGVPKTRLPLGVLSRD